MTVASRIRADLNALTDSELLDVLDQELAGRASLAVVRDDLLSLVASAHTLADLRRTMLARTPEATVSDVLAQIRIESAARGAVLAVDMLTAADVATVVGSKGKNRRSAASRLRADSAIVGVEQGGRVLYPAFQFDHRAGRLRPVVATINRLLDAKGDPWGVASWWISPLGWLSEGVTPAAAALTGEQDDLHVSVARELSGEE